MAKSDELLKQMYDSNLASQKAALQSDYDAALADLDAQKVANQKQADSNIRLTKTEADQSAVNNAEYYAAAGLSSGAKAQAKLAAENQLLADLTAIRAAQQQGDINIERQRGLLGQQFAAAIREAQANNDMARAQALYEAAKQEEAALRAQQEEAAKAMAGAGDFGLYAQLYGLTPEQVQVLQDSYNSQNAAAQPEQSPIPGMTKEEYDRNLDYAKAYAEETGDYSLWYKLINYKDASANGHGAASGAALGALGASGTLGNSAAEPDYWAETKAELEKLYPGGVISDRALWDSLVAAYGPELMKDFRFVASTGYSGGTGGGGDGKLRWNRKD